MTLYADASLLVKLFIAEAGSDQVQALVAPPFITGTALISRAEVAAGLAKAAKIGRVTPEEAGQALAKFRGQWPRLLRLPVYESLVAWADELAWELNLRGYDAVHLAAALTWQRTLGKPLTMGTYDRQLWQAAQSKGLTVWPETLG
jgi:predicted nucleic acid-binding protein